MNGFPGTWTEPDGSLLDQLAHNGAPAADRVAIGFAGTQAEKTRAVVRSALRTLLANGLITAVPPEAWPLYVMLDPPPASWTT